MIKNLKNIEIFILCIVLALCSIVYELLLSNTLAIVTSNYIWWQSMTIGIYIGGLGVGAFRSEKISDTYLGLFMTELKLSFLGGISVVIVFLLHAGLKYYDTLIFFANGDFSSMVYNSNMLIAKTCFFIFVQSLVFLIGLYSGYEIPLLMRMRALDTDLNESEEHNVLGLSYVGTLLGTLLFAYYFLPKLDVLKTSVAVAFLNLLVCFYLKIKYVKVKSFGHAFSLGGILAVLVFIGVNNQLILQRFLKFSYYHQDVFAKLNLDLKTSLHNLDKFQDIERYKSDYQYIDFLKVYYKTDVKDDNPYMMALDHRFQFATNTEVYYHHAFAHVPLGIHGRPVKNILVLGGGDGFLLRELLRHPEIEKIKIIELDKTIVNFANTKFKKQNNSSFSDKRVELVLNDAFYILRNSSEKFDAIFIDFPYPNNYDLAKLYSVEFYRYVESALRDDGFIIFDAPVYKKTNSSSLSDNSLNIVNYFNENHYEMNSIILSSVFYAGFKTLFPYMINKEAFVFAKKNAGQVDITQIEKMDMSYLLPEVAKEVRELKNYNFPYKLSKEYQNSIFHPTIIGGESL